MVKCKSGNHEWTFREDAEKCCNGFRRNLVFEEFKTDDHIVRDTLTGGWYAYRWVPTVDTPLSGFSDSVLADLEREEEMMYEDEKVAQEQYEAREQDMLARR